jgi:hypothetical protein
LPISLCDSMNHQQPSGKDNEIQYPSKDCESM